jgi:parvulin-like peptidyl-prolyl isomerase
MATRENDEKMFAGEKAFDVSPKSFAIPKVREALAKLNPGEVSEIVADADAYYVVKLEQRTGGRVRPFEEQAVQNEIKTKLRTQQYAALREQGRQALVKGATIRTDPEMTQIAIDMAMQRYPQYAAK